MFATVLLAPTFAALALLFFRPFFGPGGTVSFGGKSTPRLKSLPSIPILSTLWVYLRYWGDMKKAIAHIGKSAPINRIPIPGNNIVLINDLKLGKDLLQKSVFSGRPKDDQWCFHSSGSYGIVNTESQVWDEQRKFARQQLKRFGFGTKSMQTSIDTEIEEFIETLSESSGKVISPNKLFYLPVLNALWTVLTGQRYGNADNKICKTSLQVFSGMTETYKFPEILTWYLPININISLKINKYIPIFSAFAGMQPVVQQLHKYFSELISERQESALHHPIDEPNDFVEAYLLELKKNVENDKQGTCINKDDGLRHLLAAMTDFFVAGGDTTSTMLNWCMLHLVRNPDVQDKIFKEVQAVIGTERSPLLDDRPNCPYTEAFIYEVLRFSPVALASIPHETMQDVVVGPYLIKKGTMTFLNIAAINQDPRLFEHPEKFNPERFISPDGAFHKPERVVSFGLGKRRCLGEQLAKDNLFLYVTAICQRFSLKQDPSLGAKRQQLVPDSSGIYTPKKFNMLVLDRFDVPLAA